MQLSNSRCVLVVGLLLGAICSRPGSPAARANAFTSSSAATIDDTFDKIDPEAIAQDVAAYAAVAYWAVDTPTALAPAPEPPAPGGGR